MYQNIAQTSDAYLAAQGQYNNPGVPAPLGFPHNDAHNRLLRSGAAKTYLYWLYFLLAGLIFSFIMAYGQLTSDSKIQIFWASIINEAIFMLFIGFQILSIEDRNLSYATYSLMLALLAIASLSHLMTQNVSNSGLQVIMVIVGSIHLAINVPCAFIVRRKLRHLRK